MSCHSVNRALIRACKVIWLVIITLIMVVGESSIPKSKVELKSKVFYFNFSCAEGARKARWITSHNVRRHPGDHQLVNTTQQCWAIVGNRMHSLAYYNLITGQSNSEQYPPPTCSKKLQIKWFQIQENPKSLKNRGEGNTGIGLIQSMFRNFRV